MRMTVAELIRLLQMKCKQDSSVYLINDRTLEGYEINTISEVPGFKGPVVYLSFDSRD